MVIIVKLFVPLRALTSLTPDMLHEQNWQLQGFSDARAEEVMEKTWQDKQETLQIKTLGNISKLFQRYLILHRLLLCLLSICCFLVILSSRLRENGMNVAICTSDSRLLSFSSDSWCPFSQLKYLQHLPLFSPVDIFC